MSQIDQLRCQQEGHQNKFIDGICMSQSCKADKRILCMKCLQTIHSNCSNKFYDQEEFIKRITKLKDQPIQEPIEISQLMSITQKIVNSMKDLQSFIHQIAQKHQKTDQNDRINKILANQYLLSANDWNNGYELLTTEQSNNTDDVIVLIDQLNQIKQQIDQIMNMQLQPSVYQLNVQQSGSKLINPYEQMKPFKQQNNSIANTSKLISTYEPMKPFKQQNDSIANISKPINPYKPVKPFQQYDSISNVSQSFVYEYSQFSYEPIIQQNWNQITASKPMIITEAPCIRTIAISPNGEFIASGGAGKHYILIWRISGNQVGKSLNGHYGCVNSIKYSKCGQFIISGSNDKTIRKWNVSNQEQIGQTMVGHEDWVMGVEYSQDESYIISCSYDKTIRFWNTENGKEQFDKRIQHTSPIWCLSVSPIQSEIVFGDESGTIKLWNYEDDNSCQESLQGHSKYLTSIKYSNDGKLILSGSNDSNVLIWDAQSKKLIGQFTGHTSEVYSVNFSPDSKYIISGGQDKTVKIWNRITRMQVVDSLTHHNNVVHSAQFSLCGKFIITGSWDGEIWIKTATIK